MKTSKKELLAYASSINAILDYHSSLSYGCGNNLVYYIEI